MPDGGTFDQALAELAALPPAEQRAVLARLDAEERRHIERFRSGAVKPAAADQVQPYAAYSPWLRTVLENASSEAASPFLAAATRNALVEISKPASSASCSQTVPVAQKDRPGASLIQVAGGLLRGRKDHRS